MDTAEHDVLGSRPGRCLPGQLEGVPGDVRELDDLVTLVVVPEHEGAAAQRLPGRPGPLHQGGIGRRR